jgi:hypothetical protein
MFTSFDYLGNVKKLPTPEEASEIITAMNSKKPDKAASLQILFSLLF